MPCRWVLSQCSHMDKISFIYQLGIITLLFKRHLWTGDRAKLVRDAGTRPLPSTGNKCSLFSCFFPSRLPTPPRETSKKPFFVLTPKLCPRSDTVHVSSGGCCNCQNPYYHLGAALPATQPSQLCSCPVNCPVNCPVHLHTAYNALLYCLPSKEQRVPSMFYP